MLISQNCFLSVLIQTNILNLPVHGLKFFLIWSNQTILPNAPRFSVNLNKLWENQLKYLFDLTKLYLKNHLWVNEPKIWVVYNEKMFWLIEIKFGKIVFLYKELVLQYDMFYLQCVRICLLGYVTLRKKTWLKKRKLFVWKTFFDLKSDLID